MMKQIFIVILAFSFLNVNGQDNSANKELEEIAKSLKEDAGSTVNFGHYFLFSDPKDVAGCKGKYLKKESKKRNFILLKEGVSKSDIEKLSKELEGYVRAENILIMKSEKTFSKLDNILNSKKKAYYLPLDHNGNVSFLVRM